MPNVFAGRARELKGATRTADACAVTPLSAAAPAPAADRPHLRAVERRRPAQRGTGTGGGTRRAGGHGAQHVLEHGLEHVLEHALEHALDADQRLGTATALLLVEVTGTGAPAAAAVERRLRSAVRAEDRWLRPAPDLHAVLLTGLRPGTAEAAVERAADALLHAVECWAALEGAGGVRVSVGASLAPWRAATAAEALAQAGAALGAARAAGGDCARIGAA
ncbi:hypothetical protein [Kineococcus sp. SYSU DK005]|uniref:hypothetical protein n=1 Tax=Kineococcus sp. SYSU DK005 TaxID=3383126 RepID=UPI003D7DA9F2